MKAHDPRAIANMMLDEADQRGMVVSNLALQKLLYFAHGIYLRKYKSPLVSGYFEAWKYGPVHPAVYRAFKPSGSEPIKTRAVGRDPLTGKSRELLAPSSIEVADLVRDVMRFYGPMSPRRLVDMSHAENSPWSVIWDKARTDVAFGMRIPDNVIMSRFQHHKVSVDASELAGEPPNDDTPPTGY